MIFFNLGTLNCDSSCLVNEHPDSLDPFLSAHQSLVVLIQRSFQGRLSGVILFLNVPGTRCSLKRRHDTHFALRHEFHSEYIRREHLISVDKYDGTTRGQCPSQPQRLEENPWTVCITWCSSRKESVMTPLIPLVVSRFSSEEKGLWKEIGRTQRTTLFEELSKNHVVTPSFQRSTRHTFE